ncbi:hypothetical protein GCM10008090_24190 [Arenicella chitinivorans]|uniref:Uncharacterized protein n=1 Tax=Arenicella chitinivorans TaxID=1329800 RepID=A0A918VPJ2_9GAMM|nr:hypothetical protein [Arenicella chitinivorans]GHA13621.1 hypothetical protein GCM10008090_24190 [Arenicella chitinivorans]
MMTKAKKLLLNCSLFAGVILTSAAHATSVDADLSMCAESALAAKQLRAKKLSVEVPDDAQGSLDHSESRRFREYYISLANPQSGEELGLAKCRIGDKSESPVVEFVASL